MKTRKVVVCISFVILLAAILLAPANAQFIQQGPRISGNPGDSLGSSVALSADGNTAVVGGGNVTRIYIRHNGVWTQQGNDLPAGPAAISGDGNTVIVGVGDGALVFVRNGGVWTQQGPKLVSTGVVNYTAAVALSGDGNTALVGFTFGGPDTGATCVFMRSGGVWSQQGPKLIGTPTGFGQGLSLSLAADGNTAIVGGLDDLGAEWHPGRAWIFLRRSNTWRQVATFGPLGDTGSSVAISGDGNTAILSAVYNDDDKPCAALVFTQTNGVWRQQGPGLLGTSTYHFSASLSKDGNTAILGGWYDIGTYVFTRTNGVWSQQSGGFFPSDAAGAGWPFSIKVALSADSKTVLVGALSDHSFAGAAWAFVIPPAGPSPAWTRLTVPVGGSGGVSANGPDRNLEAIDYGKFQTNGSMFAIGGLGGNILTYDGKLFNRVVAGNGFESVAFSDTGAAVAGADKGFIYRSTDGIGWSGQQIGSNNVNGIAYGGNGVFVAVESGGHIFRSSDYGVTWTEQLNSGQLWSTHDLNGVTFGNGTFVVAAGGTQILYSSDGGITWNYPTSCYWVNDLTCISPPANLMAVAFGPVGPNAGEFVAVADTGAVFSSLDNGQTWNWTFVGPVGAAVPLQGVAYGTGSNQNYFVAVGKNGVTLIGPVDPLTGQIAWYATSFPTVYLRGVKFGENKFVAAGYGATIIQSKPLPW